MSTPKTVIRNRTRHHTLWNISRRFNGKDLIVCQTTTHREARAWASYFTRLNAKKTYEIIPPTGFRKQPRPLCDDCQTEISHLSKSRKCFECEYMDNHPDLKIFREMGI